MCREVRVKQLATLFQLLKLPDVLDSVSVKDFVIIPPLLIETKVQIQLLITYLRNLRKTQDYRFIKK